VDGVALAAVITSGVVGITGSGVGLWTARHTSSRESETRRAQRLSEVYVATLEYAEQVASWAATRCGDLQDRVYMDYNAHRERVERPDPAKRVAVDARIAAFASKSVRSAYLEWRKAVTEIDQELDVMRWNWDQDGRDPNRPPDQTEIDKLVSVLQPSQETTRDALIAAIADDLRSRWVASRLVV
jgi:hypothetical protein